MLVVDHNCIGSIRWTKEICLIGGRLLANATFVAICPRDKKVHLRTHKFEFGGRDIGIVAGESEFRRSRCHFGGFQSQLRCH